MISKSGNTNTADQLFSQGRFEQAQLHYQEKLQDNPQDTHALAQLGLIALWKNDLDNAQQYFTRLEEHAGWFQRRWPLSAQLHSRLAILHERRGRPDLAVNSLTQAAGRFNIGPFKELQVRAQQMALFNDVASYFFIEGPDEVVIPFVTTDPLPVVKVKVNHSEPVNFFIDTGGESIILDAQFAHENGFQQAGSVKGEYAGGAAADTGFGKIDQLIIGGITVNNIPVSLLNVEANSKQIFGDTAIKGIIGTGFLSRFLSTLDYVNGQLILRRPSNSMAETERLLKLDKQDRRFPMWLVETHLIFAEGAVNDLETAPMFIDTGLANAGFLTSKSIAKEAGIEMNWEEVGSGYGGGGKVNGLSVAVDKVTLGNKDSNPVERRGLKGVIFENDISIFKGVLGFHVGGLISHEFFRDSLLSFDFENMQLIIQKR